MGKIYINFIYLKIYFLLALTHSLSKNKGLGLLQDRRNDCDYVVPA